MGACLLSLLMLTAAASSSGQAAREAAPIDVAVASRAMQPGELVVFTARVDGTPVDVTVDLFGRRAQAFLMGDGRWRALVGIDLDQAPGAYVATVEARLSSGTAHVTREIVVKPKLFPTRTLRVSPDFVNPPASARERIERDSAFLREVYRSSGPARLWMQSFIRAGPRCRQQPVRHAQHLQRRTAQPSRRG